MPSNLLFIGYGNPGRLDDGLGPACAEAMEKKNLPGVTVDADYQLTVEDAEAVARHDVVIFADASVTGGEPFEFKRVSPSHEMSFTTHSVEPEAVIGMAQRLFHADTRAYVLGIRGYAFNEFGERLSEQAANNLDAAIQFIEGVITHDLFEDAVTVKETKRD